MILLYIKFITLKISGSECLAGQTRLSSNKKPRGREQIDKIFKKCKNIKNTKYFWVWPLYVFVKSVGKNIWSDECATEVNY